MNVKKSREVRVKVKLTNTVDEVLARRGQLPADEIRAVEVEAIVDTGAVISTMPEAIFQALGLGSSGQLEGRLANDYREWFKLTEPVTLSIENRRTSEEMLVMGSDVLIGQTVLEKLDFLVDCGGRRLLPAHGSHQVIMVRQQVNGKNKSVFSLGKTALTPYHRNVMTTPKTSSAKKRRPSYGDLSIDDVRKKFRLKIGRAPLFEDTPTLTPSDWLRAMLAEGFDVSVVSEKARSEFIVAPILLYLREVHHGQISIYSGVRFDIDPDNGLRGVCDFILSRSQMLPTVQAPVLVVVEAKKNDIEEGLGQCVAEMVAAQIFNQREENVIPAVYGCITTGESWQFLRLSEQNLVIDTHRYFISNLPQILGLLHAIIEATPLQMTL